jgi:hypothetical protein
LLAERLLVRGGPPLQSELTPRTTPSFLVLGVEHIAAGLDHLLFLGVLLLGVRDWRRMALVVSCFTLAHSVTLGLATLGWLQLPSQLVEVAIAASIVLVALRTLASRPRLGERLSATFAFGLLHGLGFASVLRELGVQGASLAVLRPLLLFNLGVELGQLAIGALALPALLYLQRSALAAPGTRVLSGLAAAAGLVWLVQRATA